MSTVLALRLRMDQPNLKPKKLKPSLTAPLRTSRYPNDCKTLIANKLQQYVRACRTELPSRRFIVGVI